jgi:hypothetical protein
MLPEWELWACANHYIMKHHADAAMHAAIGLASFWWKAT